MKRCMIALTGMILCMAFLVPHASAQECRWYVRYNGKKQPHLPKEVTFGECDDVYWIDRNHGDDCEEKVIYLTFDAGYENGNVEKILDTLKAENVHGAFFILAHPVLKNTDLVKRMKEEGHLVCNHTKNHKNMTEVSAEEMKKNLTDLEKIYHEKTGYDLDKYFRFPEGEYNGDCLAVAKELGYKTVFWSFGYADWDNAKQPDPEKARKKILENTHNGEVILLHPTSETNAQILPELIRAWREAGFRFGTLDELCGSEQSQPAPAGE